MSLEIKKWKIILSGIGIIISVIVLLNLFTAPSKNSDNNSDIQPIKGNMQAIAASGSHYIALRNDGTVWSWGGGHAGDGHGKLTSQQKPAQASDLTDVIAIAGGWHHTMAIKNNGTVWSWGDNPRCVLGIGYNKPSSMTTPVHVPYLWSITAIAGGQWHSVALKDDGTVWTWGDNDYGQLGNGTNIQKMSNCIPTPVSGLTGIIAIAAGKSHTIALKDDGTVWIWGDSASPIPTQIQDLTNITAISAGRYHSIALKDDGTVWIWGGNADGQLGNGSNTNSTVPIQATGLTDVIAIAAGELHSVALKKDGTVWTWGGNAHAQLGNGTNTNSTVPIQATGLTDVIAIAAGNVGTITLKSDKTVWAWGWGISGNHCGLQWCKIPTPVSGL